MKKLFVGSVLLSLTSAGAWSQVSFSTFVSNANINAAESQSGVIGIAYAGNKFVGSVYQGTNNDQLYSTNLTGGNVQKFGAVIPNGFSGEVVVTASLGQAGFNAGDIYAGAGTQIYHFSNDGSTQSLFTTVPDNSTIRGIMFDPGSSFGGKMIAVTTAGDIYTFDSTGHATLLASTHEDTEGLDIATSAWGPYAGDLLTTSENSGDLRFITPSGAIAATCTGCVTEAEVASFVPTNFGVNPSPVEGYYEANYANNIQFAGPSSFSTLTGDLIISAEFSSNAPLYAFSYSGNAANPFSSPTLVGHLPDQAEDGIFVTDQKITLLSNPEPSAVLLFGTLIVGLGIALRRKVRA
jgi:hypothetical protein